MKKLYYIRFYFAICILLLFILSTTGIFYTNIPAIQFLPLVQRVLTNFSIVALILLITIILITLIFGRIYCSTICPMGIAQELVAKIFQPREKYNHFKIKYFIAVLVWGLIIGGSSLLATYLDPFTNFSSVFSLSMTSIIITFIILVLATLKNRYFCSHICPVGVVIGLLSNFSYNKFCIDKEKCLSCGKCERICPSGCINFKEKTVDNKECLKCFQCTSVCKQNAISYTHAKQEIKFSPKRRDFLYLAGALVLLGGTIKSGVLLAENIAKELKNIILPPGSETKEKFVNKCLNCNLCVSNCPNKILVKKDNDFNAVHVDYEKGKGYCKYNCNKCSEVCPSGAIKKLSLSEKQNLRIALAQTEKENCINCGLCSNICPKGAITIIDNKAQIEASKCIGCGKCKTVCKADAIKIYPINKQNMI